jgi:hypothetical protein
MRFVTDAEDTEEHEIHNGEGTLSKRPSADCRMMTADSSSGIEEAKPVE